MPVELAPDDIVENLTDVATGAREPLLALAPLREFLAANVLDAPADLSAEPLGDGHSNVTFLLSTGVVLRRPPRGPIAPSTHDVIREARFLSALKGSGARIPKILAVQPDKATIGAPFFVMERIEGAVITSELPAKLNSPAQRGRIADELIDALVELHAVDPPTGFGKPAEYLKRQVHRFHALWDHNRTRDLPAVEQLTKWLADNMPTSPAPTVVHGDYRIGNTIYADADPTRLEAILDWEMATVGDPLADVGYLLMMWPQAGDPKSPLELHAFTREPGFPTRAQLVQRYEQKSGRSMHALDFYVALALFKVIVFMEGNYKRAASGQSDDPFLKGFGDSIIGLADRALDVTRNGFV